ncbi:MAG: pectate lyase [Planctomycetes bacterium RBG_13_44_8b]|nr:MAG: pectate lyase [Planctomycetes bacterium RBG_13_44_8b]
MIDINGFSDSRHHWYHIYEAENVIDPSPNQPCYEPTQIKEIADNILLYQKNNGGWPKNYDMRAILTDEQKQKFIDAKDAACTTFDNSTTFSQIEYLAQAYKIIKDEKYKDACIRGIDFTLSAQYANGGWPQFFPLPSDYKRRITFNDDAMVGIMKMLKNILDNKPYYSFLDSARREKTNAAFDKGLDCIIKCQIRDNDRLTVWCQQHDENDFSPTQGRAYELPSICNSESSGVVLFLMSLDNPSKEVVTAVESAVKWFEDSKISSIRVETIDAPRVKYPLSVSTTDRIVVNDPNAPPIWARFYELKTHRPLFADRRGKELYSLAEVDRERRCGYRYYTYEPQEVLDKYPAWKKKIADGK